MCCGGGYLGYGVGGKVLDVQAHPRCWSDKGAFDRLSVSGRQPREGGWGGRGLGGAGVEIQRQLQFGYTL